MLTIWSDKKDVHIQVEAASHIKNRCYVVVLQCHDEIHAELLASNLTDHMFSLIKEIRRKAYNQGWTDAKSKRKRESWFSGMWKI